MTPYLLSFGDLINLMTNRLQNVHVNHKYMYNHVWTRNDTMTSEFF